MPGRTLSSRTTFLINRKGIIRKIDRQVKVGTHGKDLQEELAKLSGTGER